MASSEQVLRDFPLVFTTPGSPVHDLLAAGNEEDKEMACAIWADFRSEILPRFESLRDGVRDAQVLKADLHSLRGTVAQFGFFLLEAYLFAWEKKESDPAAVLDRYLPGAIALVRLSLEAIERDFPHLQPTAG